MASEEERGGSVNHPKHYNAHPSGVECIDIVEHLTFNLGNAVKYVFRSDHKGNRLEDVKKAVWYLRRSMAHGAAFDAMGVSHVLPLIERVLAVEPAVSPLRTMLEGVVKLARTSEPMSVYAEMIAKLSCTRCDGLGIIDDRGWALRGQPFFCTQPCPTCGGVK